MPLLNCRSLRVNETSKQYLKNVPHDLTKSDTKPSNVLFFLLSNSLMKVFRQRHKLQPPQRLNKLCEAKMIISSPSRGEDLVQCT